MTRKSDGSAHRSFPTRPPTTWRGLRDQVREDFQKWTARVGSPMLVGTILYDIRPGGATKSNAAFVFGPEGELSSSYRKVHLVPFGEFVPLIETFPGDRAAHALRPRPAPEPGERGRAGLVRRGGSFATPR